MKNQDTISSSPRRDIQGLRALAVLAVVGAHAIGWPRGGFVGVDVFFVVSGFLITGMLLRELADSGRVQLGAFYARRARRILPASLAVLAVVTAAGFVVFSRARADQTATDAAWSAVFASNWHFAAAGTDYFHAGDAVSPLQHFWSLAVEEQFYLVWPGLLLAIVFVLPRTVRRAATAGWIVGAAGAALVAGSLAWALVQSGAEPAVAYFSTVTRVWELGVGAVLAALVPVLARMPRVVGGAMAWVGLGGVVWSFVVIDPGASGFPAPWAALPVVATALVIAGGVPGDPRHRHLFPLTNPVGVFVGDISYSLYLWHFPVIVFAAVLLPEGAMSTGLVLGAMAALSVASYFAIEQPLRHAPFLGGRVPSARTHAGAAGGRLTAEGAPDAPAAPAAPSAVVTPHRAAAASTRPAGWTPGARYYPETGRALPLDGARAPIRAPAEPAPTVPASAEPAPAEPAPAEPASAEPARSSRPHPEPDEATGSAWEAWRARFGAQVAVTGAGFGIAVLALILVAQNTFGGPVIGPLEPEAPVATEASEGVGTADPLAPLQNELANAVAASQWPELHPSLDEVIARSSTTNPARDCFSPDVAPDAGRCSTGSADAPAHIYLVGDSTAMSYAPAFRRIADDSGGTIRVTTVGLYGCRFTDVPVQNDGAGVMDVCPQRKADVRAMIAADAPTLVVMSNAYTLGHTPEGANLSAKALLAAQQAEATTYGMPGRIVHLAPPPEGADLGRCYSPLNSPYDCAAGVSATWQQMEIAAEQVSAASGEHAVSSLPFSCWEGTCPAFAGDIPTRYDRSHLTVAYAEHIAPALRWELAELGLF